MRHCRVLYLLGFIIILLVAAIESALAVKTSVWEQYRQRDFEADTPKDVSISSKNEVVLSPKLDAVFTDIEQIYIWCLAEDSKGNIYAGTGNQGKIYKINPDGQSSLFYDSPEVAILSLAIDTNDNIYAGTAPDGLIYKISQEGVPPVTLLSSEEKFVFALTFDEGGNLYAATGTNGKIYKITPEGENSVLFDSEESSIMCLLYHQGALYAGSEGKGVIYRITPDGAVSVVYQTGQKEVRTLVVNPQGTIYAGTVTTSPPKPGAQPSGPPPPGAPPEEKKSQLYQIRPDGVVSVIWTAPVPLILSMVVEADNQLLVGTGDEGKIYRVDADGDFMSMGKCDASQILAMHRRTDGKLTLGTGNPGKFFELKAEHNSSGTLESVSHDTRLNSRWGKLSWEGLSPEGASISFATRTGNTGKPDNTWSDWSSELTIPEGSQITSPTARYIQWRATLSTTAPSTTPILKRVAVASVQSNIEPRFTSIEIHRGDKPKGSGRPPDVSPPGKNRAQSQTESNNGKRRATWKVDDANNDTLQYTIYYKSTDETNWKLLKKKLDQPNYTWDTTSMPDGRYTLKIQATDKLSNPPNLAKVSERTSDPFDIDNTQPAVGNITATANGDDTYQIVCAVEDAMSYIQKAVYKIDNDEHWKVMFPADGIFDSKREELMVQTETLPAGEHTITIQATDAEGNTSVGRGKF